MDKATLVEKDLRIGRDVIGLLRAADLSVDDAFWAYVPQVEEWRLVLSSPRVKELGVRNSYLKMSNALHKSPLWDEIPLSRISLFAPDDDVIERLNSLEKHRYEGALEIIKNTRKGGGSSTFQISFVPYRGDVGTIELSGGLKLEEFLRRQIGVGDHEIQLAMTNLNTRSTHTFDRLQLSTSKLREIGLLHSLHPRRVYRKQ